MEDNTQTDISTPEAYDALTADNPLVEHVPYKSGTNRRMDRARNRALTRGALIACGAPLPDAAPPAPTPDEGAEAAAAKAEQDAVRDLDSALHGSSSLPSMLEVGWNEERNSAKVVQLGTVVRFAFEASGMTVADWNALDDGDRDLKLAAMIEELKAHNGERAPVSEDHPEGAV